VYADGVGGWKWEMSDKNVRGLKGDLEESG